MQFAFLFMKSSLNHSSVVYNFRPMFGLGSGFLEGNAFWKIPMKSFMIPASMHLYAYSSDKDGTNSAGVRGSQQVRGTIRCVGQLETFQSGIKNVNSHVTKYLPLICWRGKGQFLTPVRWYKSDLLSSLNVHIKTNPTEHYVMPPNFS